jgi:hypothetical protein
MRWSKRRKIGVALLIVFAVIGALPAYRIASFFAVYPVQYFRVGRPSYAKARSVADSLMAKSSDGPWDFARGRFILDFDGTETGRPTWVFRYHNSTSGQNSKRIYVPIPEYRVYLTAIGLDPLPLHGSLP